VRKPTIAVEANNGVGKVSIETHARSESNRQIGEKAHAKRSQSSNRGCRRDQIPLDFLDALQVHQRAVGKTIVLAFSRANAVAATVRDDARLKTLTLLMLTMVMVVYYN
jgi:hypothetical protein